MDLRISNLTKDFDGFKAVNNFSYQMDCGVYGLLGVNGAGKTTLMRMLTTLMKPTSGQITWDGEDVFAMDGKYRMLLGYLPQDFGYYPDFSVYDYLMYIAALKGIRPAVAKQRVKELLKQVGLVKARNKKMKTLSGGMKRRASLARALAYDAPILLMDEPFGQLDAQTRYAMEEEVLRIWEQEKRTIIFVTNNIEEAVYLADRIVLLSNCPAKVKQIYDLKDLPRPRNTTDPEFLRIRKEISDNTDLAL